MNAIIKFRKIYWLLVVAVFIVLSVLKNGFYVDEIYSNGFAESSNGAFMTDMYDDANLIGKTIDGHQFRLYLKDNGQLSYKNILHNVAQDVHPPLYFFILHTFNHFLGHKFSKWSGLCVNFVILFLLFFFFYKLSFIFFKDKEKASWVTFFLAFLPVTLNMEIYIRMYLLEMALITGLYWQTVLIFEKEKISLMQSLGVFIFAILSYLTHFYGLVYAFFLTLGMCGALIFTKQYQKCIVYALIMLFSVIIVAIIYPSFFQIMIFSNRGQEIFSSNITWHLNFLISVFCFALCEMIKTLFGFVHSWTIIIIVGLFFVFYKAKLPLLVKTFLFTVFASFLLLAVIAPNMGIFNSRYYAVPAVILYLCVAVAVLNLPIRKKCVFILACLWGGINFYHSLFNPFLERNSDIYMMGKTFYHKKVVFFMPSCFGQYTIFNLVPAFQNAESVKILWFDKTENKDEILQNLPYGTVVLLAVGWGKDKYQNKMFSGYQDEYHYKHLDMYYVGKQLYDAYEKL